MSWTHSDLSLSSFWSCLLSGSVFHPFGPACVKLVTLILSFINMSRTHSLRQASYVDLSFILLFLPITSFVPRFCLSSICHVPTVVSSLLGGSVFHPFGPACVKPRTLTLSFINMSRPHSVGSSLLRGSVILLVLPVSSLVVPRFCLSSFWSCLCQASYLDSVFHLENVIGKCLRVGLGEGIRSPIDVGTRIVGSSG